MLIANTLFILLLSGGSTPPDHTPYAAAADLTRELSQSDTVSIYYISRTGEYSYTPTEIKKDSSALIKRKCGGNCSRLMIPIVQHLRESAPVDCQTGYQTILIELDARLSVVYSRDGRAIEYKGKCYFNRDSVRRKIKEAQIIPL